MLDANNVEMKMVKYCLSAYNKKNEFNGGLINIGSVNCQDFYKFKDIDHFSKYIPEILIKIVTLTLLRKQVITILLTILTVLHQKII